MIWFFTSVVHCVGFKIYLFLNLYQKYCIRIVHFHYAPSYDLWERNYWEISYQSYCTRVVYLHYASSYSLWEWKMGFFFSYLLLKSGSYLLCIIMELTGNVYYIYCIATTHIWSQFLDKLSIMCLLGIISVNFNCLLTLIITLCSMVNFSLVSNIIDTPRYKQLTLAYVLKH